MKIETTLFDLYLNLFSNLIASASLVVAIIVFLHHKKRELKISAIKAGTAIEEIVIQWSYIDMVLNHSFPEEYSILRNCSHKNMNLFEKSEIESALTKKEIKATNKMFCKNKYNTSNIGAPTIIFNVTRQSVKEANSNFPNVISNTVGDVEESEYLHTFHRVLIDTLNKVETICTMIELNAADEYTVFTLIGQSFCNFIGIMYYFISMANTSDVDGEKKLLHTINVFNLWKNKLEKSKRRKTKCQQKRN